MNDFNEKVDAHSFTPEISDDQIETILGLIDEETKMSIQEMAEQTEYSTRQVQLILEELMERGQITSTPDWKYRQSRRSEV